MYVARIKNLPFSEGGERQEIFDYSSAAPVTVNGADAATN